MSESPTPVDAPAGTRLVIVADDLLELIGTRSERGDRLTFEWGEPDNNGWYTPIVKEHRSDNIVARAVASERARIRALEVALRQCSNTESSEVRQSIASILLDPEATS